MHEVQIGLTALEVSGHVDILSKTALPSHVCSCSDEEEASEGEAFASCGHSHEDKAQEAIAAVKSAEQLADEKDKNQTLCTMPREEEHLYSGLLMMKRIGGTTEMWHLRLAVLTRSSSLAFYWHSKKVSGPPLCPSRLTKRRTYRPRSVIYRYVSRQSSEKII
jgi:hypothetical protein